MIVCVGCWQWWVWVTGLLGGMNVDDVLHLLFKLHFVVLLALFGLYSQGFQYSILLIIYLLCFACWLLKFPKKYFPCRLLTFSGMICEEMFCSVDAFALLWFSTLVCC